MSILESEIRRLEEIGAKTWPARKTERRHGWLLSIDEGVTRRANSVLPVGDDAGPAIGERIDEVERCYRGHGLDPCFKMTRAALPGDLDARLDRRGYRAEGHSLVLTMAPPEPGPANGTMDLFAEATPEWLACDWPGHTDDERWISIVRRIAGPKAFALAHIDGMPAGSALANADAGWTCITAVHTLPAFRRRGVGRTLVMALAEWARPKCSGIFLQVEADNEAALRLYASVGFTPAYDYHYRTLRS